MRPQRKKVVITGGVGFIGSYLMDGLAKECYDAGIVVNNLKDGETNNRPQSMDKLDFRKMDIKNYEALKNVTVDVKVVFHLVRNANVSYLVEAAVYGALEGGK